MIEPTMACPNCDGSGRVGVGIDFFDGYEIQRQCSECTSGRVPMTADEQMLFLAERFKALRVKCECARQFELVADGVTPYPLVCPSCAYSSTHVVQCTTGCIPGRDYVLPSERDVLTMIEVLEAHGWTAHYMVDPDEPLAPNKWFVSAEELPFVTKIAMTLPAAAVLAIQEEEQADE